MSTRDNPDGSSSSSSLTRDVNDVSNNLVADNDAARDVLNDTQALSASAGSNADDGGVGSGDKSGLPDDDDEIPVIQIRDVNNGNTDNLNDTDNHNNTPPTQDSHTAESPSATATTDDSPIQNDPTTEKTELTASHLSQLLRQERLKSTQFEEKLKHALADYQNLQRKTRSDIETGIAAKLNEFALDFIKIHDDFLRAKNVFIESKINTEGMDSILKNMDSVLSKYNIHHIDALGEIFDPHLHEAISVVPDPNLDEGTITQELRRGYTSNGIVIRPTLVEITKKE